MRVRNKTGVPQSFRDVRLPPGPWLKVPEDLRLEDALQAYRLGILEIVFEQDDQLLGEGHIHWKSPFSLADGYATAAQSMVLALLRQRLNLHVEACWFRDRTGLKQQTIRLLDQPLPDFCKVGVCMSTPGEFHLLPTPIRIGITMYEADDPLKIYPEWRHDCDQVDMLVAPSQYVKGVFGEFFRREIKVVPLAVDPTFYTCWERKPKDLFTFVTWGTLSSRKSPAETIDCFQKAFPDNPKVRLILKTRLGVFDHPNVPIPQVDDYRVKIIDVPRGQKDWTTTELLSWLQEADCCLWLSKGEGFGLPPREALCTGLPLICADNTGMSDLKKYAWSVPTKETEESPLGGNWYVPDWDAAIETMRYVYDHREEVYPEAKRRAERYIRENGDDAAASQLRHVIEGVHPTRREVRVPERLGLFSDVAHQPFLCAIKNLVPPPGPLIDLGVGEGIAYEALTKAGYNVLGIVDLEDAEAIRQNLEKRGVTPKLKVMRLWDLQREHGICYSMNVLQRYSDGEITRILRAAAEIAKPVFISVPSVFYPDPWPGRMMRRSAWETHIKGLDIEWRYYGDKKYLMGTVKGTAVPAVGITMNRGWLTREGVYRPGKAAE